MVIHKLDKMKILSPIKYLLKSIPLAAIINLMWHFTSLTECTMLERIAGWSMVWLLVAASIWAYSTLKRKMLKEKNISCILKKYMYNMQEDRNKYRIQ